MGLLRNGMEEKQVNSNKKMLRMNRRFWRWLSSTIKEESLFKIIAYGNVRIKKD